MELLELLKKTRSGYTAERVWHTFLLDAFTGGGGFQGRVKQPDIGWWGAASTRYTPTLANNRDLKTPIETYLEPHPREDVPKLQSRANLAHYWNFVGPLTNLKLSYMLRKGVTPQNRPDELGEWRENVDGSGGTWDEVRPMLALMAAIWGWTPAVVDMDPAEDGMSRAQADDAGLARPRIVPMTPANLLHWSHDGDAFTWAKFRTSHTEQETWASAPVEVDRYTIWTAFDVTRYEVRKSDGREDVGPAVTSAHPFGQVPVVVFRHLPCPGDPVHGLPMHADASVASKRLFNLLSELDEHMRSQVFAVLVYATKDPNPNITLGTDNALTIDTESKQRHGYISPDPGIADVYEKRIEATITEGIYRSSRVEFSRPTGQAVSGVARAYEFAQTNRALADFAAEFARGEEWMDELVWAGMGRDPSELADYSAQAPQDFDVEDLAAEIDNTVAAIAVKLGATITKRLKLRLAERLDPNMPPDVRAQVEEELDALAAEEVEERAAMREMLTSGGGDEDEDDPDVNHPEIPDSSERT